MICVDRQPAQEMRCAGVCPMTTRQEFIEEGEQLCSQLFARQGNLFEAMGKVVALKNKIATLTTEVEERKTKLLQMAVSAKTEEGKPQYSNEAARKAYVDHGISTFEPLGLLTDARRDLSLAELDVQKYDIEMRTIRSSLAFHTAVVGPTREAP